MMSRKKAQETQNGQMESDKLYGWGWWLGCGANPLEGDLWRDVVRGLARR